MDKVDKTLEDAATFIAAVVFGPIFLFGALSAVWALFLLVLPYVAWSGAAVGGTIGVLFFSQKLRDAIEQKRSETESERQRCVTTREQRQELEALYSQVLNAHYDLFDAERRRSQPRIGP
jgi:hypothetical protein